MAVTSLQSPATASILRIAASPFVAAGRALVALTEANAHVQESERLHAMSDEELASLGIKREDIARHVFRGSFFL